MTARDDLARLKATRPYRSLAAYMRGDFEVAYADKLEAALAAAQEREERLRDLLERALCSLDLTNRAAWTDEDLAERIESFLSSDERSNTA